MRTSLTLFSTFWIRSTPFFHSVLGTHKGNTFQVLVYLLYAHPELKQEDVMQYGVYDIDNDVDGHSGDDDVLQKIQHESTTGSQSLCILPGKRSSDY